MLERLPLPSLRMYTSVSVLLLASAIYFSSENMNQIQNKQDLKNLELKHEFVVDTADPKQLYNRKPEIVDGGKSPEYFDSNAEEKYDIKKLKNILSDNIEVPATNETLDVVSSEMDDTDLGLSSVKHVEENEHAFERNVDMTYHQFNENSPYLLRLFYNMLSEGWSIWVCI